MPRLLTPKGLHIKTVQSPQGALDALKQLKKQMPDIQGIWHLVDHCGKVTHNIDAKTLQFIDHCDEIAKVGGKSAKAGKTPKLVRPAVRVDPLSLAIRRQAEQNVKERNQAELKRHCDSFHPGDDVEIPDYGLKGKIVTLHDQHALVRTRMGHQHMIPLQSLKHS